MRDTNAAINAAKTHGLIDSKAITRTGLRRLKVDYDATDGVGKEQSVFTSRRHVSTCHAETVLWDVLHRLATHRIPRKFDVPRTTVEASMMLLLLKRGEFNKGDDRPVLPPVTTARRAKRREDAADGVIKAHCVPKLNDTLELFHNTAPFKTVLRGSTLYTDNYIEIGLDHLTSAEYISPHGDYESMWQHEIGMHPRVAALSIETYMQALVYYGVSNAMQADARRLPELYQDIAYEVGHIAESMVGRVDGVALYGNFLKGAGIYQRQNKIFDALDVGAEYGSYEVTRAKNYAHLLHCVTDYTGLDSILRQLFMFMDNTYVLFNDLPKGVMDETGDLINLANKHVSDSIGFALDALINVTSPYYRYSPQFVLDAVIKDTTLVRALANNHTLYSDGGRLVYTVPTLRSVIKTWVSPTNKKTQEL